MPNQRKKGLKFVGAWVPNALRNDLVALAKAEGRDVTSLLTELLAQHLQQSEASAWLLLFGMFTGCRSSELRRLRLDAGPEQAGHRTRQQLHLGRRSKQGVNPFVEISPTFGQLLECFERWHAKRHPASPWYFPGFCGKPIAPHSYGHSLARAARRLGLPHCTPHSIRAYFVTLHRRAGLADSAIAALIGDKTVSLISQTYGDAPQGDKLSFLPANGLPAWLKWSAAETKIARIA